MIPSLREQFNRQFTEEKYERMLADIAATHFRVDFKISETPIFIPADFKNELIKATTDIVAQVQSPRYRQHMHLATPPDLKVPNETDYPTFLAVDFAICRTEDDKIAPRLIEMQGFPSLFGFQTFLSGMYRKHYDLPGNLTHFFNGYDERSYASTLREVIVGDANPENVILMEIEPEKQKTRIDFACTEAMLGISTVCITKVKKEGRRLYYEKDGRRIPIDRIYNRVIFDELNLRKDLTYHFNFKDDLEVKWVGHPNWFFNISKFTLPFLESEYVPKTYFLNELKEIPADLENYVLKPLFSFAGAGVKFDVTRDMIDNIADKDRSNYILMKKVHYEPVIQTLDVPSKAEVRMLLVNKPGTKTGEMTLLTNLVRLSKGKMLGVDFNKGLTWVGGSVGLFQ